MPANYIVWTPAMTERFLHLVDKGVSYLDIAKIISGEFRVRITKNACVGKGRRLHVPLRSPPRKRLCRKRNARRNPERRKLPQSAARPRPPRKRKTILSSRKQFPLLNLTLLQLRPTSCRWPTGHSPPFSFCGDHQAEGSSYCLKHTLIATPGYGRAR